MIKVIEEKKVPRAQIECSNCGSLLEYGNADLLMDYEQSSICAGRLLWYCFTCPVCGCKVIADRIHKKEG